MSLSRVSEQNKNKIIDWLKQDGIPCKEIDVTSNPEIDWNLSVGLDRLSVYSMPKTLDRVIIQADIRLAPEHQELVNNQWSKIQLNTLLFNITSSLVMYNVRHQILFNSKQEFTGVRMHLFLIDNLNKETYLTSQMRIGEVFVTILNQLSMSLGIETQKMKQVQEASGVNPLAS